MAPAPPASPPPPPPKPPEAGPAEGRPGSDEWLDEMVLPALMRHARRVFIDEMRAGLEAVGCGDLPRNGAYVLGAISRSGTPLSEVIEQLRVSKQTAGQLVDQLVLRGYLERTLDPEDRRRMNVSLTERGRLAAGATRAAIEGLTDELADRVGTGAVTSTKRVLFEIIRLGGDR